MWCPQTSAQGLPHVRHRPTQDRNALKFASFKGTPLWGRQRLIMKLRAAVLTLMGLSVGTAMAQESTKLAAAWNQADSAVKVLRSELLRSSKDKSAVAAALRQLDIAVSDICSVNTTKSGVSSAPAGPVRPPDIQPSTRDRAEELARRERLTMETHRPAGPPGTGPAPSDQRQGLERTPCDQVLSALSTLRTQIEISDQSVSQLEQALARLPRSVR